MTTPNRPSDHPHDCVGHCVGTASETLLPGRRETTASVGPHPYGTDAVSEPAATASETTASTASGPTHCGHTDGPWTCTIVGPHQTTRDGRIRHYYRAAA